MAKTPVNATAPPSVPISLTPEMIAAIVAKLRTTAAGITVTEGFISVNVGGYITDDQYNTIATNAGQALLDFLNAPTI